MILKVEQIDLKEADQSTIENYTVLGAPIDTIEVGSFNSETNEYFDCILRSKDAIILAQFRYFDKDTIPNHTVESEA